MILMPIVKMDLQESDSLPDSVRGEGGFGSTGK
jgi:dUTP pyrophosphatase